MTKTKAWPASVFTSRPRPKTTIHIIDALPANRATLARACLEAGFHGEIYENFAEFLTERTADGVILASNEAHPEGIPGICDALASSDSMVPIIGIGIAPSTRTVVAAMQAGAMDYVEIKEAVADLEGIANRASAAFKINPAFSPLARNARKVVKSLTPREHEVLQCILDGCKNKDVAERLGISPRTVEIHRANAMKRIKARSLAQALKIFTYATLR